MTYIRMFAKLDSMTRKHGSESFADYVKDIASKSPESDEWHAVEYALNTQHQLLMDLLLPLVNDLNEISSNEVVEEVLTEINSREIVDMLCSPILLVDSSMHGAVYHAQGDS